MDRDYEDARADYYESLAEARRDAELDAMLEREEAEIARAEAWMDRFAPPEAEPPDGFDAAEPELDLNAAPAADEDWIAAVMADADQYADLF